MFLKQSLESDPHAFVSMCTLLLCRATVEQVASLAIPAKGDMPVSLSDMKQVSAWRQLCVLLWRQWIAYPRNVSYTGTRLLTTLVVACCFGSIYQNKVRASPGALLWYTPHAREHALTPTIVRQPLHTLHLPLAGHYDFHSGLLVV